MKFDNESQQLDAIRDVVDEYTYDKNYSAEKAMGKVQNIVNADVKNKSISALVERVKALEEVLTELVDDEECRLDHHGYCQTHFGGKPCSVEKARKLLAPPATTTEPEKYTVTQILDACEKVIENVDTANQIIDILRIPPATTKEEEKDIQSDNICNYCSWAECRPCPSTRCTGAEKDNRQYDGFQGLRLRQN